MIPPIGKKRYHTKLSFFSFFGNLPLKKNEELTKNEYRHQYSNGIRITIKVVSSYSVVKMMGRKCRSSSENKFDFGVLIV
jgi:hypothetical protein